MVKSADTPVLGAGVERRAGSSPALPTIEQLVSLYGPDVKIRGPYFAAKDGRCLVDVFCDGRYRTTQLAKLLLEIKLRRRLVDDETVDHQDDDCTNDSPENLQLLSRSENSSKRPVYRSAEYVKFRCPQCGVYAEAEMRNVRSNRAKGKSGPFCSRRCAGKASHAIL